MSAVKLPQSEDIADVNSVRVAGGIVLALHENKPSTIGLIIAAIIFEGAGVIPLMLTLVGFLRIMFIAPFCKPKMLFADILQTSPRL